MTFKISNESDEKTRMIKISNGEKKRKEKEMMIKITNESDNKDKSHQNLQDEK
jgi:L-rhamnose mutarotase